MEQLRNRPPLLASEFHQNKFIFGFIKILAIFLFCFVLADYSIDGDQVEYDTLYQSLLGAQFEEVLLLGKQIVDSGEPMLPIIFWISANIGLSKTLYSSIMSTVLLVLVSKVLEKHRAPKILHLIIFTNFYMLVLITSAEKLKVAYISYAISLLVTKRWGFLFFIVSILSHFQSIILFSAVVAGNIRPILNWTQSRIFKVRRFVLFLISCVMVLFFTYVFTFIFGGALVSKAQVYQNQTAVLPKLIPMLIMLVSALVFLPNKKTYFFGSIPLFIAGILIGTDRVNMIAYTVFMLNVLIQRKSMIPVVVVFNIYLSLKGVIYMQGVVRSGEGFSDMIF